MRMQFFGKSSPNLVAAVLLLFSLIVLYNYWNVSTYNKDLATKLHTLEQQSISISRSNAALQSSLEQAREENTNLQLGIKKEEVVEQDIKAQLIDKESALKKVQNELLHVKKDTETLREEKKTLKSQVQAQEQEINELKEQVVNLEAQITEKKNANEELTKELDVAKKSLEKAAIDQLKYHGNIVSSSSTLASKASNKIDDSEPVLLSDPAVPYPDGWMNASFPRKSPKVSVKRIDLEGVMGHQSPVIIFDPPNSKPIQARFSVMDMPKPGSPFFRPEQQMGPDMAAPAPLKTPDKSPSDNNGVGPAPPGGEEDAGAEGGGENGAGVLPVPGAGNLDAAEDDGDHPLKELQDDQSPDGVLSAKELVGVVPAPPAKEKNKNDNDQDTLPVGHHSGQDIREAAHLGADLNHNNL